MMSVSLPTSGGHIPKVATFKDWLVSHGAEMLEPTNEWEVLRFRANGETLVVYRNARGRLTWPAPAADAWRAWKGGKAWSGTDSNGTKVRPRPIVKTLLARDGADCFFCRKPTTTKDRTVEHLVARIHGGPNHISNLFLAHEGCNRKAGHLSAVEKIKIREGAA